MCLIVSHTCQLKYLHIRSYAYITVNNFALSNTLVVSASCMIETTFVSTYAHTTHVHPGARSLLILIIP